MIGYHAAWIVPIAGPPLRDGWVSVEGERVAAFGAGTAGPDSRRGAREIDLGRVAIMPGLVNAHTHLELSYLHDRVPAGPAFVTWIRSVLAERRRRTDPAAPEILDAVTRGIGDALRSGTALVGDISNTLVTFGPLAESKLAALIFREIIGFNSTAAAALVDRARQEIAALRPTDRLRVGVAAHAPYSVAPMIFKAIRRGMDDAPFERTSVHLAESPEEVEFIGTGTGSWRALLEEIGAWDAAWKVPRVSPVEYLDDLGFLSARTLAVHGVQASAGDLARLASRGTTLVACPRSNRHTGAGRPPIEQFYNSGVQVAVGTDSLASTADLNVFSELAELRALAPSVPARMLLESATRQGARALGFDGYGTIEPGSHAKLIAVDIPPAVDDVEEYLVSGIQPEQVRWVGDESAT